MVHPVRVAHIVTEHTDDANIIAAAMMHDVLEDTDVTAEEMRRFRAGGLVPQVRVLRLDANLGPGVTAEGAWRH
jgi:hypothetical protein